MPFLKALSLTFRVRDWLSNSRQPRILHVFDRACNLINERREVLSLVTPQIGNGPFNLVVEDGVCFSDFLDLDAVISISPGQLLLGERAVHTADAVLWTPHPDWDRLHSRRIPISNRVIHLKQVSDLDKDLFASIYSKIPISNFSFAVAHANIASARTLASKLAGLGAGLTPAGDDFMMGAMYAAWILHPPEVASVLGQEIASIAAPLTTSLSTAWLKAAARGEAGILWHEFLNALVSGDASQIRTTTKDILAVGETSGADALAGFTSVFRSWMERTNSSHE